MKFRISKNKVIVAIIIITALAAAFWYGGDSPGLQGWNLSSPNSDKLVVEDEESEPSDDIIADSNPNEDVDDPPVLDLEDDELEELEISQVQTIDEVETDNGFESSPGVEEGSQSYSESQGMVIDPSTGKDKYLTDPVPEGKPLPVEPQASVISDVEYTATLSVRCDTILDNIDWLDPEKIELVPEDGLIFPATQVSFYEGESVLNVLQREMKKAKIHMEFENTPIYNSAYIEGINNLYEFDCGELSGWMYKVNDWFPNYGVSRYKLEQGDLVEFVYTCDFGRDVGGHYAVGD